MKKFKPEYYYEFDNALKGRQEFYTNESIERLMQLQVAKFMGREALMTAANEIVKNNQLLNEIKKEWTSNEY